MPLASRRAPGCLAACIDHRAAPEPPVHRDIEQHAVTATRFWMTPAAEKYQKKLSQLSQIYVQRTAYPQETEGHRSITFATDIPW